MIFYRLNVEDKSGFFSKLSRTLYIGNLDENVNDATLYKYFGEFGDIIVCTFINTFIVLLIFLIHLFWIIEH